MEEENYPTLFNLSSPPPIAARIRKRPHSPLAYSPPRSPASSVGVRAAPSGAHNTALGSGAGMTVGLDLVVTSPSSSHKSSSSSSGASSASSTPLSPPFLNKAPPYRHGENSGDIMLTTPKFLPDSAGGLLSPRGFPLKFTSPGGPSSAAPSSSTGTRVEKDKTEEDMLMTPVLTTPMWPPSAKDIAEAAAESAQNLSTSGAASPSRVTAANDLPMDSEIGLRSPCDGLLAKRRKQFKHQKLAASSNSVNSDSNSCDTPTSQNSPRDLSTTVDAKKSAGDSEKDSKVQVKLEFDSSTGATPSTSSSSAPLASPHKLPPLPPRRSSTGPRTPTLLNPISPRLSLSPRFPVVGPSDLSSPDFKLPNSKPENLRFKDFPPSELPSHYTPSPLAVPSPNWTAVDKYFKSDMLKTPKVLDGNFFDFLTPHPSTPRSKLRDRSPGHETDRYSGRDQRLSPRLSPRFPIPEAPTDLSSKGEVSSTTTSSGKSGRSDCPNPYPAEAEDLSMGKAVGASSSKAPSPPQVQIQQAPTNTSSSLGSMPIQHPQITQLKREYVSEQQHHPGNSSSPHQHHSMLSHDPRSRTPSGGTPLVGDIKCETPDEYDYQSAQLGGLHQRINQHPAFLSHQGHPNPGATSLYLQQFAAASQNAAAASSLYHHRQMYERSTPPPQHAYSDIPPPAYPGQSSTTLWPPLAGEAGSRPPSNHSNHWNDNDDHSRSPPSSMLHNSSGGGVVKKIKLEMGEDHAGGAIPGLGALGLPAHLHGQFQAAHSAFLPGAGQPQLPVSSAGSASSKKETPKKQKKAKAPKGAKGDGESKRVYSCPHCQRSYDWNYNLNRHLKYECGKENAFQCSKCGRKFPHKQNCVYHLKRKHKIVCDTIDQYVANGLVVFKGAGTGSSSGGGGTSGQQAAVTADTLGTQPSGSSPRH